MFQIFERFKMLFRTKNSKDQLEFQFSNLARVDDVDPKSSYICALRWAIQDKNVFNIALSGPYGSGKSSIISSYQRFYGSEFVNISLATFGEAKEQDVDVNLIERGILQQLLYSVSATAIPYSRFKRIVPVRWRTAQTVFLVLWLASAYYLTKQESGEFWPDFFKDFEWNWSWFAYNLFPVVVFVVGGGVLIGSLLKLFVNLPLKKISLWKLELETDTLERGSFLSEHMDEILYFFEATKYNVAVFEDLDRFNKPEIFHKLREINKILNDGRKKENRVRFIYAVRDHMFMQGDRTKFFDFIIPVVPIVDASNSREKLTKELRDKNLLSNIDSQFIRDASYYLDDLRIIKNIVNEFVIYLDRLPNEALVKTKLLAMMVYKNIYAQDFENLHYRKGRLYTICAARSEFEQRRNSELDRQLEEIAALIAAANAETVLKVEELIAVYLMKIVSGPRSNPNTAVQYVQIGGVSGNNVTLAQMMIPQNFEKLVEADNFVLHTTHPGGQQNRESLSFKKDVEELVDENQSFIERKENIDRRSQKKRVELERKKRTLSSKKLETRILPLKELLKGDISFFESLLIEKDGAQKTSDLLLRSLLLNGYVDEHYADFTSNFHEGRLGRQDMAYLKSVRAGLLTSPDLKLENPNEVYADLDDPDFEKQSVLNISLFDHLLEGPILGSTKAQTAINFICKNFQQADEFLVSYYENGSRVGEFIETLAKKWDEIAVQIFDSSNSLQHIAKIIIHIDPTQIVTNMNEERVFTGFVENFGDELERQFLRGDRHFALYEKLEVRFPELSHLRDSTELLGHAAAKNLYRITARNIGVVLSLKGEQSLGQLSELEHSNYTSVLNSGDETLQRYIEDNIRSYVENVLLELPDNCRETGETIKRLLNNDLDNTLLEQVVAIQEHVFDDFEGIPERCMAILLEHQKVQMTWPNLSKFVHSDAYDPELATRLLSQEKWVTSLKSTKLANAGLDETEVETLSQLVVEDEEIDNDCYAKLVSSLPGGYNSFPSELAQQKHLSLAKAKQILLTSESYEFCKNDAELLAELIQGNERTFAANIDSYPIGEDVTDALLDRPLRSDTIELIIRRMSAAGFANKPVVLDRVARLIVKFGMDLSKIEGALIELAVVACRDISVALDLLLRVAQLGKDAKIMEIISKLPPPYRNIAKYGKRPKIPKTDAGLKLVQALKERGFISSYNESDQHIRVNTHWK